MRDHIHYDWWVVIEMNPCSFYDIPSDDKDEEAKSFLNVGEVAGEAYVPTNVHGRTPLARGNVNLDSVDSHTVTQELHHHKKKSKIQVLH